MGLEKLIVSQTVKVAKDTGRLESTIDTMKSKLMDEGMKVIESAGINPADLPFNITDVLNGNIANPTSLLTPTVICSIPPLTEKQKQDGTKAIESVLSATNSIIQNKNSIAGALQTVQIPLNTMVTTSQTLDTIISTVKGAIKVIKAIPIPTAIIPPSGGIGLPVNVLTILSDSLDQLDKLLTYGKGVTGAVPTLVGGVSGMINTTVTGLNALDASISPVVTTLTMVKTIIDKGDQCPALPQSEIDEVASVINADVQESLTASGVNSNPALNAASEAELIAALQPDARPSFIYKGYVLSIEFDPDNEFSFPRRRIKGFRDFERTNPGMEVYLNKFTNNVTTSTLYNSPKGIYANDYSYSTSVEVLVDEIKYKIDTFLLTLRFGVAAFEEVLINRDTTQGITQVDNFDEDGYGGEQETVFTDAFTLVATNSTTGDIETTEIIVDGVPGTGASLVGIAFPVVGTVVFHKPCEIEITTRSNTEPPGPKNDYVGGTYETLLELNIPNPDVETPKTFRFLGFSRNGEVTKQTYSIGPDDLGIYDWSFKNNQLTGNRFVGNLSQFIIREA